MQGDRDSIERARKYVRILLDQRHGKFILFNLRRWDIKVPEVYILKADPHHRTKKHSQKRP